MVCAMRLTRLCAAWRNNIMSKILKVNNLKISFRTSNGTLKAVRDISFELERGKTLAIVGESGSGKSVTSKAILGILAGNSIIEGGEILYDGRDLLKISEEEMCKIRGDRISMIFQDPLSSLNPIVKIGRQITEAMLLKNKATGKAARKEFNELLAILKESMIASLGESRKDEITEKIETFDRFNGEAIKWENDYNNARSSAEAALSDIEDFLFLADKKQHLDVKSRVSDMQKSLSGVHDVFLTADYDGRLTDIAQRLKQANSSYRAPKSGAEDEALINGICPLLSELRTLLSEILSQTAPNFFRIGFYKMKNPDAVLGEMSVEELNEKALLYLNENFMNDFLSLEEQGVAYSFRNALEKKKNVIGKLKAARDEFANGKIERGSAMKKAGELADMVEDSIDKLEIAKDSLSYTFRTSLCGAIDKYCTACVKNPREEARYERQSKKREKLIERGKTVDWKVVPKTVYDLDELRANITGVLDTMSEHYAEYIASADSVDFAARSVEIVDYLKEKASLVVYRITGQMAKEKAIRLMEEVGIPEPRIRYYQYPFEFSGGMRQRIVIAIALAANPDILICDEPTTALDVTIQAQILELINKLKEERGLSVIFITHDLGVVANMADDIAVMYAGKIVEYGTADDIFYDPRHPYTWALLSSMPDLDTKEKLDAIPGTPPNMIYPPEGDAFADRNKYAMKIDFEMQPPKFPVSDTHWAATWLLHPNAPKVSAPKIITDRIERMKKAGGEDRYE